MGSLLRLSRHKRSEIKLAKRRLGFEPDTTELLSMLDRVEAWIAGHTRAARKRQEKLLVMVHLDFTCPLCNRHSEDPLHWCVYVPTVDDGTDYAQCRTCHVQGKRHQFLDSLWTRVPEPI